jgi:hypothetical protein
MNQISINIISGAIDIIKKINSEKGKKIYRKEERDVIIMGQLFIMERKIKDLIKELDG